MSSLSTWTSNPYEEFWRFHKIQFDILKGLQEKVLIRLLTLLLGSLPRFSFEIRQYLFFNHFWCKETEMNYGRFPSGDGPSVWSTSTPDLESLPQHYNPVVVVTTTSVSKGWKTSLRMLNVQTEGTTTGDLIVFVVGWGSLNPGELQVRSTRTEL